jgi:hypothetical protein
MKRIEEMADSLLSLLTLPIRVTIGIFNAVEKKHSRRPGDAF